MFGEGHVSSYFLHSCLIVVVTVEVHPEGSQHYRQCNTDIQVGSGWAFSPCANAQNKWINKSCCYATLLKFVNMFVFGRAILKQAGSRMSTAPKSVEYLSGVCNGTETKRNLISHLTPRSASWQVCQEPVLILELHCWEFRLVDHLHGDNNSLGT